ncbi:MAG TPA: CPBP family glutamic-type intramembrane protease [Candidatus Saccharimonadales bacterium]|nr:CPBP family glutamic-type intramembrane protease [Candidatus Saccharimonadales bacterium]
MQAHNLESYSKPPTVAAARATRALVELSIGYGLILLVVWTPQPWQRMLFWAALAWIVAATVVSFDGFSAMGLSIRGFLRSLWIVALAMLLAAVSFTLAARFHTSHIPASPALLVERYWGYAIWAFLQEFLLLDFFLLRLLRLLPDVKMAVIAAAGLFTIAHLPSPILTLVTLVWGLSACLLFLRYRSLYTLGMAHVIFGVCIAVTVPLTVTHNMKVGLGYLKYRPPALTANR